MGSRENVLVNGRRKLTRRESQIVELMSRGKLTREIAEELKLTANNVKSATTHIYAKLGCRNRVEASVWVLRQKSGEAADPSAELIEELRDQIAHLTDKLALQLRNLKAITLQRDHWKRQAGGHSFPPR